MKLLSSQKCLPCEGNIPPLTEVEIFEHKKQLKDDWNVIGGKKIHREFSFKNFVDAMKFVNAVANIAEKEEHHPDMHIFYNKVSIELWTHAVGGLSRNDFIIAAKLDMLQ